MASRSLLADLVIDAMYKWKVRPRSKRAHLVPLPETGLTPVSHCGQSGVWRDPAPGVPRCARCEATHARLTHDARPPGGAGRLHR